MAKRIFIGYEHASVQETQFEYVLAYVTLAQTTLASALGFQTYLHTDRDIPLGSDWQQTLDNYIMRCDILIACITTRHSSHVQHEIDLARMLQKKLLPIYPGDDTALHVYGIAHLQGLSSQLPDFLDRLVDALK